MPCISHLRERRWPLVILPTAGLVALVAACAGGADGDPVERARAEWSSAELQAIAALSLDALGAPPPDPSNRWADDADAARMGEVWFHELRFASTGRLTCSDCHKGCLLYTSPSPRDRG